VQLLVALKLLLIVYIILDNFYEELELPHSLV